MILPRALFITVTTSALVIVLSGLKLNVPSPLSFPLTRPADAEAIITFYLA